MAFTDNLEFLSSGKGSMSKNDLMRYIKMRSLGLWKGRTLHKKFLIIDETQDLTQKQMQGLIPRAGIGTKVVCLGNVKQITTPYLTGEASGLTHAVEVFKSWERSAHITLAKGERSPLAEFAANNL